MGSYTFDYKEYWIEEIARQVEEALDIHKNKYEGVFDDFIDLDYYEGNEDVVAIIEEGTKLLRKAYSFASNIGKMMSQDTGPEDFLKDYREECADIDAGNYKKSKYWVENNDE